MVRIKQFGEGTAASCPCTHQYFAVGPVLAGQADPHPLIIPVSLARLPTRLSRLVSWKTMRAVCRRWVIRTESWSKQLVTCQPLSASRALGFILYFCWLCKWLVRSWQFEICRPNVKNGNDLWLSKAFHNNSSLTVTLLLWHLVQLDFWGRYQYWYYWVLNLITIYWLIFHFLR